MNKLFRIPLKNPKSTIFIFILLCVISIIFTINLLKINTSTESLINPKLDFKVDYYELKNQFKVLDKNLLIRVSGKSNNLSQTAKIILDELRNKKYIDFAYSPNLDSFFYSNFFSFLNNIQKQEFVNKLFTYQPFISEINNNPRLEGFNNLLELFIKSEEFNSENIRKFNKIFLSFIDSLDSKKETKWSSILNSKDDEIYIIFGINKKYLEKNSFSKIYNLLQSYKTYENQNIKIDYTGGLLIDHEEIGSVTNGAILAGFLSIIFVGLILWYAFKNIIIIFSLLLSIIVGLIITLGLTSLLVGSLNLISVAFAVLFIGLSVDFGIQVCSRILENQSINIERKIFDSLQNLYKTLIIAAVPSMVGFFSFVFTDYIGLSELGIISCIGLLVGLVTNFFFLPCLLKVFSDKAFSNRLNEKNKKNYSLFLDSVFNRKKLFFFIIFSISFFSIFELRKIKFDSDALNLKDQNLPSVKLAKELIEQNPTSDYVISVILAGDNNSEIDKLAESENIKSVFSYNDIIYEYSSEELEYLKILIDNENPNFFSDKDELERLKKNLRVFSELNLKPISKNSDVLFSKIENLQKENNFYNNMQIWFFKDFKELTNLIIKLGETDSNFSNIIPDYYKNRYISELELQRFEIFPSKNVSITENLETFVQDVRSLFPNATGMPVVQLEAGKIVKKSFLKAFMISICFLIIFIFILFKNLKLVILSISCLLIASIFTLFFMIILKIQFNFANMIALPLLYSLGISYPIYYIRRIKELKNIDKVIKSSTPKAITISAATTIASFATLAISQHNGTSSMGILLFISLMMTLLSSIFFLPIIYKSIIDKKFISFR